MKYSSHFAFTPARLAKNAAATVNLNFDLCTGTRCCNVDSKLAQDFLPMIDTAGIKPRTSKSRVQHLNH